MNLSNIVRELAKTTGINQPTVKLILEGLPNIVAKGIKSGENVTIQGLCTFSPKYNEPRERRKINTNEVYMSKGSLGMKMKVSPTLKDILNN